ncbi:MAG: hypothetical protein AB4426_08970 [Xenococcaceae cyanobacterium]
MKALLNGLGTALVLAISFSTTALAEGVATVTSANGDVEEYKVYIVNTDKTLYVRYSENDMFVLDKSNCQQENKLQVCTGGEGKLVGYGVTEVLSFEDLIVFTNTTTESINIPESPVTLAPDTVLLESLTMKGRYITIMGNIDSTDPSAISQKSVNSSE